MDSQRLEEIKDTLAKFEKDIFEHNGRWHCVGSMEVYLAMQHLIEAVDEPEER